MIHCINSIIRKKGIPWYGANKDKHCVCWCGDSHARHHGRRARTSCFFFCFFTHDWLSDNKFHVDWYSIDTKAPTLTSLLLVLIITGFFLRGLSRNEMNVWCMCVLEQTVQPKEEGKGFLQVNFGPSLEAVSGVERGGARITLKLQVSTLVRVVVLADIGINTRVCIQQSR